MHLVLLSSAVSEDGLSSSALTAALYRKKMHAELLKLYEALPMG